MAKDKLIAVRIPEKLAARLQRATDRTKKPYAPTMTQVLLRGLELALSELERK